MKMLENYRDRQVKDIIMRTDMLVAQLPSWLFRFDRKFEKKKEEMIMGVAGVLRNTDKKHTKRVMP